MKDVAVVILNWNTRKQLELFLPPLIKHSNGARIIVADNASSDDSVSFLQSNFPEVGIIRNDRNYGFAGGYNVALSQVTAEFFVLLNSDVEVTGNWLPPLIQRLQSSPDVAACMPKILSWHRKGCFEYAGAAGGFIDKYGFPFCRGRVFDEVETDKGQYDHAIPVFWATGACMAIKADAFHLAGGFDDDFFAHMEEIDLCWRLKNLGYTIYVEPGSMVYHVGGGTLDYSSPFKTYLNFRNNLFLLQKNLPASRYHSILARRKAFDAIAMVRFLLTGKLSIARAILKAHYHFWRDYAKTRAKRRNKNLRLDYPEVYQKSVVFQRFLRGRKRFIDFFPSDKGR